MAHQVDIEWLMGGSARLPEVLVAGSIGQAGSKRLVAQVDPYYETVHFLVQFNGENVAIGGDGGLADAVAVYNAIDEDRPC